MIKSRRFEGQDYYLQPLLVHTSNSSSILIVSTSVFKITPYIHKIKEAPNLNATNGRCMIPKLKGSYFMATLFNGTTFGNTIEILIVLQYH
jgi:hypothetical protein